MAYKCKVCGEAIGVFGLFLQWITLRHWHTCAITYRLQDLETHRTIIEGSREKVFKETERRIKKKLDDSLGDKIVKSTEWENIVIFHHYLYILQVRVREEK